MFDSSKKERKYVECFKSLTNGSCNYCKMRAWSTGYKIYAMKKPDGKWLACTDKKCYLEQGGTLTIYKKDVRTTVTQQPERAFDIRIESCAKGFELVYEVDKYPFDKEITQGILLSVIENFNQANPDYTIMAKKNDKGEPLV